jgi:hypothetical protein
MLDINHVPKLLAAIPGQLEVAPGLQDYLAKRGPLAPVANDLRRFPRFFYPASALMSSEQTLPALPRDIGRSVVLTKDLSRTGIALLHTEQFYPGEVLKLWLPCGEKQLIVVRCKQQAESCFEAAGFFV